MLFHRASSSLFSKLSWILWFFCTSVAVFREPVKLREKPFWDFHFIAFNLYINFGKIDILTPFSAHEILSFQLFRFCCKLLNI